MILHLVTDRRRLPPSGGTVAQALVRLAREASAGGVDLIQVRERDMDAGALVSLVRELVAAVRNSRTRVVVNDRVDVALAAHAHGVHLRGDSIPAIRARELAPPGFLVGQSVHSVEEATAAAPHVNYLVAGTVWPTRSKPEGHTLLGLAGLGDIAGAVRVPVLAIGGITDGRLPAVAAVGAGGVAGIGYFLPADPWPANHAEFLQGRIEAARRTFDTYGRAF